MTVKQTRKSDIYWKSYDTQNEEWFMAQISLYDFSAVKTNDELKAQYLKKLLKGAVRLNSEFLSKWNGFDIKTYLEFNKDWGLGSSSTLTYMVAQWAGVNPLLLHFECSNGSGYDVACAGADLPITYCMDGDAVNYTEVDFDPKYADKLYFIHLNKKQSSSFAIDQYLKQAKKRKTLAKKQSAITESVLKCNSFNKFKELITEHENITSEHIGLPTLKQSHFGDFDGAVKSLGAWGGDFILAAADIPEASVKAYFLSKGFETVITYDDMRLTPVAAEVA